MCVKPYRNDLYNFTRHKTRSQLPLFRSFDISGFGFKVARLPKINAYIWYTCISVIIYVYCFIFYFCHYCVSNFFFFRFWLFDLFYRVINAVDGDGSTAISTTTCWLKTVRRQLRSHFATDGCETLQYSAII